MIMPPLLSADIPDDAGDCSTADIACLQSIDAQLGVLIRQDLLTGDPSAPEPGSMSYLTLWIGLLLGGGHCTSFAHADGWATFIRYNLDDLLENA